MMPRRLLALLLAARAITTATASSFGFCPGQCTCIGDDCGDASTGATVSFIPPTSRYTVPCVTNDDCEDAGPREGPYYEACWTVADGFPTADLPVSYCAEEQPRRRLRFSTYVDDRCFLVERGVFYTDFITLAAVDEEADEIYRCAAASLAGVPPSRVVLEEIRQGTGTRPQVIVDFFIAVRGEAEALEVQTRLKYGSSTPPPVPLPPFDILPLGRRLNTGSEGNERATEAIKTCAVTRSAAPSVWHAASVDPYVAPPRVVQEREIPPDVQGCCCGADFS